MSNRTVTTVLSAGEVASILATHTLERRGITAVPGSRLEAEMLAVFEKDPQTGAVSVTQYRIEVKVEEERESWKG